MKFITTLINNSKKSAWGDGAFWFFWNIICSLLPIWITLILLALFKQKIDLIVLTNRGEFFLYSTSFLGTWIYLIMRDFRKAAFPSRGILSIIAVPTLLISSLFYAVVALLDLMQPTGNVNQLLTLIDRPFYRITSIIILPLIFIFTFLIVVVDNIQSTPDIQELAQKNYAKLSFDFDNINKGD